MANPYLKQHKDFCAWIERDRNTMPADLLAAAERFRCALWAASKSPGPTLDFVDELAAFAQAHAKQLRMRREG